MSAVRVTGSRTGPERQFFFSYTDVKGDVIVNGFYSSKYSYSQVVVILSVFFSRTEK